MDTTKIVKMDLDAAVQRYKEAAKCIASIQKGMITITPKGATLYIVQGRK